MSHFKLIAETRVYICHKNMKSMGFFLQFFESFRRKIYTTYCGWRRPKQTNEKRNFEESLPATVKYRSRLYQRLRQNHKTMSRRESYLTFPDQKDANARFYTRVGTPKYLITKPIENQVNIVTTLVTRIKA